MAVGNNGVIGWTDPNTNTWEEKIGFRISSSGHELRKLSKEEIVKYTPAKLKLNHQIKTKKQIESRLIAIQDNPDTQKLIRSFLTRKKYIKLIPLPNEI